MDEIFLFSSAFVGAMDLRRKMFNETTGPGGAKQQGNQTSEKVQPFAPSLIFGLWISLHALWVFLAIFVWPFFVVTARVRPSAAAARIWLGGSPPRWRSLAPAAEHHHSIPAAAFEKFRVWHLCDVRSKEAAQKEVQLGSLDVRPTNWRLNQKF